MASVATTSNTSQSNMAPPESSYSTTSSHGYFNRAEAQETNLESNLMKMIEVFKEEMNTPVKETQENTNR